MIPDGDVAGAISTAWPDSGADIMFGVGGTPEGVIAAAALKCMGGAILGKLWPRNDDERNAALDAGYDLDQVLTTDRPGRRRQLLLRRHRASPTASCSRACTTPRGGATTQSLVMRSRSGTVRQIDAQHRLDKFALLSRTSRPVTRPA